MGRDDVVSYNWEPTCPNHGLKSEWYRVEGKPKFDAQNERLRESYAAARKARADWETRENRCQRLQGILFDGRFPQCEKDAGHVGKHLSQFAGREW
jgi:hypothetical protein